MLLPIDANDTLNMQALRAKTDEALLGELIRKNRRFILGCAYKTIHRFISESDDEWSVALIAFHEAVMAYEDDKGSFRSFAALVIRRRLLDHLEKQKRTQYEIPVDLSGGESAEEMEPSPIQVETQRAIAARSMAADGAESALRDEIEAMQQVLGDYGFSFFDLAGCSPKAQETKAACAAVIRELMADPALTARMRSTRSLPAGELCRRTGVPRKIPENHRKYIIAAAEILLGDYPGLAEYLRFVRKGSERE